MLYFDNDDQLSESIFKTLNESKSNSILERIQLLTEDDIEKLFSGFLTEMLDDRKKAHEYIVKSTESIPKMNIWLKAKSPHLASFHVGEMKRTKPTNNKSVLKAFKDEETFKRKIKNRIVGSSRVIDRYITDPGERSSAKDSIKNYVALTKKARSEKDPNRTTDAINSALSRVNKILSDE